MHWSSHLMDRLLIPKSGISGSKRMNISNFNRSCQIAFQKIFKNSRFLQKCKIIFFSSLILIPSQEYYPSEFLPTGEKGNFIVTLVCIFLTAGVVEHPQWISTWFWSRSDWYFTYQLCDLRKIIYPLCASFLISIMG